MLVRDARRALLCVCPAVVLIYVAFSFFHLGPSSSVSGLIEHVVPISSSPDSTAHEDDTSTPPEQHELEPAPSTHHEISSLSTKDKRYFKVDFGPGREGAINPNIIPHPLLDGVWVIVAQAVAIPGSATFTELVCYASFDDDVLRCNEPARDLPIEPTKGVPCPKAYEVLDLNVGPHDARVFYGPHSAYTIYGSNSRFSCFGQFIQSFPALMEWQPDMVPPGSFPEGTEMSRPGKHGDLEKNWFVFWDKQGDIYAHYDIVSRSFAKLAEDGSAGPDLAPAAAQRDEACLAKYLPAVTSDEQSVHQATNSLSVTLCKRADPSCLPDDSNTVIFSIFHHKTHANMHSVYEPYVMAFRQEAPFEVYGVSQKPIWIRGRERRDGGTTQMMYVTSISWKARSQRYHGYLDDEMFLGFGIEDRDTGGIDVLAGDVLAGLNLCSAS